MEAELRFPSKIIAKPWDTLKIIITNYTVIPRTTLQVPELIPKGNVSWLVHMSHILRSYLLRKMHHSQDITHNVSTIGITKDQYGLLVNPLQHFLSTNRQDSTETYLSSGAVNFTGIMARPPSVSHGIFIVNFRTMSHTWIVDSGASHYMTYNKSLFVKTRHLSYPLLVIPSKRL